MASIFTILKNKLEAHNMQFDKAISASNQPASQKVYLIQANQHIHDFWGEPSGTSIALS